MLWITSQSERTVSPKMNWPFSLLAIDELKINLKSITEMLENYVLGRWPMAAHILQVAYYDTLRELRVKMLEAAGYQVTSVSGNDNAMGLDGGFKTHYPKIPVVVLQFSSWEKFPEADVSTFSEDPTIWLTEVASILKS